MRTALFTGSLLLLLATAAAAGEVIAGWGDSPSNGAPTTHVFDCQSNTGSSTLVFSVVPETDLHGVNAFLLDLTAGVGDGSICDPFGDPGGCVPPSLPPYWELGSGGCRAGAITAGFEFAAGPGGASATVLDPWQGGASLLVMPWVIETRLGGYVGYPQPYTVGRYRVEGYLGTGESVDMLAGQEYYVASITLRNTKSAAGGCDGCCVPVRFLPLVQLSMTDASVAVFNTGSYDYGPPLWQGQSGSTACLAVPVRTRTWGALKSAYR